MDADFGFIVLTPAGSPDASLAIAASRAGALGVLNLEFEDDLARARSALGALARHARSQFGVLLGGDADQLLAAILADAPRIEGFAAVLLTPSAPEQLEAAVADVHRSGLYAYLVVTSLQEAQLGERSGVDGLIAKGHEAGGAVGDESAFVLLQRLLDRVTIPVWAHGGAGLHTTAACHVAGAAGVVLDSQLLLARETPLSDGAQGRIGAMDGSETVCLGASIGSPFRVYARPCTPAVDELRRLETDLQLLDQPREEKLRRWRAAVRRRVDWQQEGALLAVGQDAAFASGLARRFGTVGGILAGLRRAVDEHCSSARKADPLAEGAPLAQSHATRYPIVQGPMTRVSDSAAFAAAVADNGALPFLALALMRSSDVAALLEETRRRLGERPWGVGILGFVPPDLRAEQLAVIRAHRPPYALIAGGRPDQARELEVEGIPTYLHVPSPGLLEMFLSEGARRFVFEGRECGGHVGPRTSFVLWESMVDVLLEHLPAGHDPADCHVLFAGGIHDARSASMVAALAGPLLERGVRVGVLLGTAYLFTEEAVEAGAITRGFQQAVLDCDRTALVESGPGHATRCAPSPFVEEFEREKARLARTGLSGEALRGKLERLNVGRLRIATKGLNRHPNYGQDPNAPRLVAVSEEEQRAQGLYMMGQVAALRDRPCTMMALHQEIAAGGARHLAAAPPSIQLVENEMPPPPAAVAIVGMACILPGAPDLPSFWANVLNNVDAVTEVPPARWDWRRYFDPDKSAPDKAYSRWGGFIPEIPFDPVLYGMPPSSLTSIEPFQLLTLAVVRAALQDAGFLDRPFARERASVILGAGGGAADLTAGYMMRSGLPALFGDSAAEITSRLDRAGLLPRWTEDSFPGLLMNVAAGRVANRFDLGGVNYTVDAACASSLAAVHLGVRELETGTSDVAVVGGLDAVQNPFSFLCFSSSQALSPSGRCRPFDAEADGIAISEGFAVLILKRLADAERDGDRIYAVLRGIAGSSDGRDRSMTAPRPEGQLRALRRAYAQARFSPATLGLIEAHGTGTVLGDQVEVESLTTLLNEADARQQSIAIGSVKSMIGHTKVTAGVAGLIKVALALHHRVLPSTLGVSRPNPKAGFPECPLYVNSETRPWLDPIDGSPRRAGVSAFGFGGTNFHAVVEEYTGDFLPNQRAAVLDPWPTELLIWKGDSRQAILDAVSAVSEKLERPAARPRLADLAYTLALQAQARAEPARVTLAIVASDGDLRDKLRAAIELLRSDTARRHDLSGIHYAEQPITGDGEVAFLFPGQGSQYVNMVRDLAILFPRARARFEQADRVLRDRFEQELSRYIFPPPCFTKEEEQARQAALMETNVAQPALGAASLAVADVLRDLGVEPRMVAGHSYGEFVALCAAGCFDEDVLFELSEARGRFIRDSASTENGTMAAIDAEPDVLRRVLAEHDVVLANLNAPRQTVISGSRAAVEQAIVACSAYGLQARRVPVSCAFHSPLVAPAQQRLAALLRATAIRPPRLPVFSNTTAAPYPDDPTAMTDILVDHLVQPVDFVREIAALYEAGARIFVEVGPRSVLSGLVARILGDRPHLCVPLDQAGRPGLTQLLHGLAALSSEGVSIRLDRLYHGRSVRRLDLARLELETGEQTYTATTWLVNGGRARPARANAAGPESPPEPLRVAVLTSPLPGAGAPASPLQAAARQNGHADSAVASSSSGMLVGSAGTNGTAESSANGAAANGVAANGVAAHGAAPRGERVAAAALVDARTTTRTVTVASVSRESTRGRLTDAEHAVAPPRSSPPAASSGGAGDVMQGFQQLMQRFLDTQQNVMLAYLGSPPPERPRAEPPRIATTIAGPFPELRPAPVRPPAEAIVAPALTIAPPAPAERIVDPPVPAPTEPLGASAPPSSPIAGGTAPLDERQLVARLLAIVSERTGYPIEMLGLEADLEADLGIDSIKRTEIVGTFVRSLELPDGVLGRLELETLTTSRSLGQILASLGAALAPASAEPVREPAGGTAPRDGRQAVTRSMTETSIGRFTLRAVAAPPSGRRGQLARDGVVVITEDGRGVAAHLARQLRDQSLRVVRIGAAEGGDGDADVLRGDLGSLDDVARLVQELRDRYGRAAALVHLAPLRPGAGEIGLDPRAWQARLDRDVRGFFFLARALRADLEQAALEGGAAIVSVTEMGGAFAGDQPTEPYFPGHAGITGFLKTLAHEWPSVRVKAVDTSPSPPSDLAACVLSELTAIDDVVEVGYRDARRVRIEHCPAPLEPRDPSPGSFLDSSSVLLVTGGARGITAEAALELARRYRPTLLLVGRTALPSDEPPETAGLTEPSALKRAIMEQQRRAGGDPVTPRAVEQAYQRLVHQREVRENLLRLRQTGARAEYVSCDVRDADAFGALIRSMYQTYRRIDGVIHGAGVIEDKLVRDKTPESFDRVVGTKLDSLLTLARELQPASLRFLALFSSVAGRLGNRGQADYAAANEVLSKMAAWLKLHQRWPGRVVAFDWGPWATVGMAGPGVAEQFMERGIALVPVEVGCQALVSELLAGPDDACEVVIAGGSAVGPTSAQEVR